jgi:glycosyltransferase involved in cell wall biosynthesis
MNLDYSNISFIIPAYNCADKIQDAVESILNGNYENGDEIIVVNDGSTDDTVKVVEKLITKYPQIVLLNHHHNKGSAAAGRNTGIDYSKNELIFCLDSDNILAINSVPELKQFMLKENADAAAFGEIHYFIGNIGNITHKWVLNQTISFIDNVNTPQKTPCSSGNYLFTKQSWLKAGRYNESIGGAYDSWAFGCAQLATGTKMLTFPETYYYHQHGYNSTYVQQVGIRNVSLMITQILIPYLNLIDPEDVNYIFHSKNRENWFDKTNIRSLKVRHKKTEFKTDCYHNNYESNVKRRIKKILNKLGLLQKI